VKIQFRRSGHFGGLAALAAAIAGGGELAACASHEPIAASPAAPSSPPARTRPSGPVYRLVQTAHGPSEKTFDLPNGAIGVAGDHRSIVWPDGRTESAPAAGMGPVAVPARLGGGFLFWGQALGYASTFLGPITQVAPLQTNVIGVRFGHDALLLFGPNQPRRAYGLNPPRRLPLSPHGVVALGGADDDRVLAVDAAGRALASTDGGKSWNDVTAQIHGQPRGIVDNPDEVGFVVGKNEMALGTDGQLEAKPLTVESSGAVVWTGGSPRGGPPADGLRMQRAVLNGIPRGDGHVLVGEGADVIDVDLESGNPSGRWHVVHGPSGCAVLTLDAEGIAVCPAYSPREREANDVLAHVATGSPVIEKTFAHHPVVFASQGMVVAVAPCEPGEPGEDAGHSDPANRDSNAVACVRAPDGKWREVDASAALEGRWKVLGFLPREDGTGVVPVVWDNGGPGGNPKSGLLDIATRTVTVWDADVSSAQASTLHWVVRRDGSIHAFTHLPGVARERVSLVVIDKRGHVTFDARTFAAVQPAGRHALARGDGGRLWQTSDEGASWEEIARPPSDDSPPGGSGGAVQCGQAGCLIQHTGGAGAWLRVGWPTDPPTPNAPAPPTPSASAATSSPAPAASAGDRAPDVAPAGSSSAPSSYTARPVPKLVCRTKAELTPASEGPPLGRAPAGTAPVFAGQRMASVGTHDAYRDRFDGPIAGFEAASMGHALRAVLGSGGEARSPGLVEALYVETFDPTGRVRHASGVLRDEGPPPRAARGIEPRGARPVLAAARTGETAGMLLGKEDHVVWITSSGVVRSVRGCRHDFDVYGGVVDAHGKLWIACESYSRAVDVIDADTGETRLSLPAVLPWVWQPEMAFPLYGGGRATYLPNPDAIVVTPEGKLAVLRIPSEEPATVDDPAWLLAPDAAPIELAPWSTLEPATSAACAAKADGVRALVQTVVPWVSVEGATPFRRPPGMTAIVRWGRERVCLEAIEAGDRSIEDAADPLHGTQIMAVARFASGNAAAGLVGIGPNEAYRVAASCTLESGGPGAVAGGP
jgi:hypothetical protein